MRDFHWTPHSGYHWLAGMQGRFFEGWYFRLTLPESAETFAFMYSIDDPAGDSHLSGGAAQILGPGEQYLYAPLPNLNYFWAWRHCLGVGHWQRISSGTERRGFLPADAFFSTVQRGYQATATLHQGCVEDIATGAIARWHYHIEPVYGWGPPDTPQLPTAGLLSYLPVADPGWQIVMAHGRATGWADWQGKRYQFQNAPVYAEKNWGSRFPRRWFWIQANAFASAPDLTLTAAGGLRQVLGNEEAVALVGVHYRGQYIALTSLNARFAWKVAPWGHWHIEVQSHRYHIVITGVAPQAPAQVRVPTLTGLRFACWDTTHGELQVDIWQRSPTSPDEATSIVSARTSLAGLEVGGEGWQRPWHHRSR